MHRFPMVLVSILLVCCASPTKHFTALASAPVYTASAYRYAGTVDLGEVDAEHMTDALKGLLGVQGKNATLRIDSPGGEIFLGLKWIQLVTDLKKRTGLHITCIVDGSAYSMAAVILESPVCDVRLATPSSTILFHNGKGSAQGTVEAIEQGAQLLEAMNGALACLVADRMQMTPAEYRERVRGRDWVMAVPEALANHVIDGIVPSSEIAPPGDA